MVLIDPTPHMIRHTQSDFDVHKIIEEHLVTSTLVSTDGLLGRFDTLRVALEHLLTYGIDDAVLAIKASEEELQFSGAALASLIDGYARWLQDAGLPPLQSEPLTER